MVIDRLGWTDPARNGAFAVPAVALSVWVFAYSLIFGPISVLAFYALWLPLLASPDLRLWQAPHRLLAILALPALALLSTIWSDRPETSLRAAIQYGTTIVPGLIAARVVSLPNLARGLALGGTLVLAYSHWEGRYSYDVVDGSFAFAGAFQSKNQLGLYASLTLLGALACLVLERRRGMAAALALPVLGFAAVTLRMTESAGAIITLALALAGFGLTLWLSRLAPAPRLAALAVLLALIVGGGVLAVQAGAFDSLLGVFGKDTTLTGRTYLWARGIEYGQSVAPSGLGYYAFWVPGRAEAEELWLQFHISSFSGFHFHNTAVEAFVALGPLGLVLVGGWLLGLLLLPLRTVMGGGAGGASGLLVALGILFTVRAMVEIDFLTPYTAGSFLVPFLLLAMADRAADRDARAARDTALPPLWLREPFPRAGAFSADAK
jgi:exopolysaccharide production protein ExoQ